MTAIIEPGTPVAIYPTEQGMCADTGSVVCYNKHDNSYTVTLNRPAVGWLDVPADRVEVVK